jgi:catechol 2,3-dioxygenase-like lactoylglutathione lyase family enzyme
MDSVDIHHVGFWVSAEGFDEMLAFLANVLGLRVISRESRGQAGSGERAWVQIGDRLRFEVLTGPQTQPRPDVPVHPEGNVVGTPHIGLTVRDLPSWEAKLRVAGYPATRRMPDDMSFMDYQGTRMRALWFTGPAGIGFELFDFGS